MRYQIKAALTVLILSLSASAPLAAGPLEDGMAAYERGDYTTAIQFIRPLAGQGFHLAQFIVGDMYSNGLGVAQDDAEAAKWYRKAADQSENSADFALVVKYVIAHGTRWEIAAVKWYRKAAEHGRAWAQYRLGLIYEIGQQGVPQDYSDAVKWYRKAADQGHAVAQSRLGLLYEKGQGVAPNFVLAHMWYNLANSRENRDKIARRMTPQQIAHAQSLAAKWQPNSNESIVAGGDIPKEAPAKVEAVSTGTGFFVSQQGHLLTNHHVVEKCANLMLRPPGLPPASAALVASDPHNDLALLKSASRPPAVAVFSSRKRLQLGQAAIIFGFPLSGVLSSSGNLTTGAVSAVSGLQDDPRLFQISAPVQPGNSGGPVLDASGAVIGVVVGKLNARAVEKAIADIPQNVNFAIKGEVAVKFLGSNVIHYVSDTSDNPISVENIATRATRFTVLVECLK